VTNDGLQVIAGCPVIVVDVAVDRRLKYAAQRAVAEQLGFVAL